MIHCKSMSWIHARGMVQRGFRWETAMVFHSEPLSSLALSSPS